MLRGTLRLFAAFMLCATISAGHANASDLFQPLVMNGHPVRWFPNRAGQVVLSYAIARSEMAFDDAINCKRIRQPRDMLEKSGIDAEHFRSALKLAFSSWERAANMRFVEIDDPSKAAIVIGEQVVPQGYAFSNVTPGTRVLDGYSEIKRAQVCLNPMRKWKIGFDGDRAVYDLQYTLTHEIGHAIGLDHPIARGQLMSFRYDETLHGLSSGDIAGAEFVYGARREAHGTQQQANDNHDRAPTNAHAMAN